MKIGKRLCCLVLTLVMAVGMIPAASAASQVYYNFDYRTAVVNSRITQKNSTDCALCSISTIEAYLYGATSTTDKDTVYNTMVNTNLGTTSGNPNATAVQSWANLGYVSTSYSLQALYDQLEKGYPVIVHRYKSDSAQHWSVVCAYIGSTSNLEESGFIVADVSSSYNSSTCLKTLTDWKMSSSGYTLDRIAYRKNGFPVYLSGIRMAINFPEAVHPTGTGHGVYGYITSNSNLTTVKVGIFNAVNGNTVYYKTITPNAKKYTVYNLDSAMTFASWSAGKYYYVVYAQDAAGNTKTFTKYFTIASSWSSSIPTAPAHTFSYNSNGGSGSMSSTSVKFNDSFAIADCAFTRSGYHFTGWNVKRLADSKWYSSGGWQTEADISSNGYTKKLYTVGSGTAYVFTSSWLTGATALSNYTWYPVWEAHTYGTPTFTWSADKSTCTATSACTTCGSTTSVNCAITTSTDETYKHYTATCTLSGKTYTDTVKVAHAYGTPTFTWSEDHSSCTAKFTCSACGKTTSKTCAITTTQDEIYRYYTATCTLGGKTYTDTAAVPYASQVIGVADIFEDVTAGAWYEKYIQFVYDRGLMSGVSSTKFEPYSPLSRAMVAQILYAQAGKPAVSASSPFLDVQKGSWYYDAVVWAYHNGIVSGMSDRYFAPNSNISREQFAVILYAHAGKPSVSGSLSQYPDAASVGSWAKTAMIWATQKGIISGTNTGELNPCGNTTRAEAAVMLTKYFS